MILPRFSYNKKFIVDEKTDNDFNGELFIDFNKIKLIRRYQKRIVIEEYMNFATYDAYGRLDKDDHILTECDFKEFEEWLIRCKDLIEKDLSTRFIEDDYWGGKKLCV